MLLTVFTSDRVIGDLEHLYDDKDDPSRRARVESQIGMTRFATRALAVAGVCGSMGLALLYHFVFHLPASNVLIPLVVIPVLCFPGVLLLMAGRKAFEQSLIEGNVVSRHRLVIHAPGQRCEIPSQSLEHVRPYRAFGLIRPEPTSDPGASWFPLEIRYRDAGGTPKMLIIPERFFGDPQRFVKSIVAICNERKGLKAVKDPHAESSGPKQE